MRSQKLTFMLAVVVIALAAAAVPKFIRARKTAPLPCRAIENAEGVQSNLITE